MLFAAGQLLGTAFRALIGSVEVGCDNASLVAAAFDASGVRDEDCAVEEALGPYRARLKANIIASTIAMPAAILRQRRLPAPAQFSG
jgi:hypothetical protein